MEKPRFINRATIRSAVAKLGSSLWLETAMQLLEPLFSMIEHEERPLLIEGRYFRAGRGVRLLAQDAIGSDKPLGDIRTVSLAELLQPTADETLLDDLRFYVIESHNAWNGDLDLNAREEMASVEKPDPLASLERALDQFWGAVDADGEPLREPSTEGIFSFHMLESVRRYLAGIVGSNDKEMRSGRAMIRFFLDHRALLLVEDPRKDAERDTWLALVA